MRATALFALATLLTACATSQAPPATVGAGVPRAASGAPAPVTALAPTVAPARGDAAAPAAPGATAAPAPTVPAPPATAAPGTAAPSAGSPAGASSDGLDQELIKEGYKPAQHDGMIYYCKVVKLSGARYPVNRCYTAAQIRQSEEEVQHALNHLHLPGACHGMGCS